MNYLKKKLKKKISLFNRLFILTIFIFLNHSILSKELKIDGNEFSDKEIILSIIGKIPDLDDKSKSNYILKKLNNSGLFKSVEISYDENNYFIKVIEYPSINNIFYKNNDRFKDEEIDEIIQELQIYTLSKYNIDLLTDDLKKLYQTFGYNNIQIETEIKNLDNNSADLYLNFTEGSITKISKIKIYGNKNFNNRLLLSKIKSKTKTITNIFANNNFKLFQINNDIIRLKRFYKSEGYKDIKIDYNVEYFQNNKVDININIIEGEKYYFSSLVIDNKLDPNQSIQDQLDLFVSENNFIDQENYNNSKINELEIKISEVLELSGQQSFKIESFEKITKNQVDLMYQILPAKTIYINQINITGNTRTYDYVIRRELMISEGDTINDTKLKKITKKLNRLPIFSSVEINKTKINENLEDLTIDVEETQTGTFNVGLSIGTLDGLSFVSGLKERNINGSGRSLEFLINTSEDNRAFTLSTDNKFILNNEITHQYSTYYKENDFSKSKSYKLNSFIVDTNLRYLLSDNLYHKIGLGYSVKDYKITDSSTVSSNILKSSGQNVSLNLSNEFTYNNLNSFIKPSRGNYISFSNFIETPSSSLNGFVKNVISTKKYIENSDNIYSVQAKLGNIFSLNDSEILSDNKFSLGGRWLRGFDTFGAGPRNSRTDYVGGNNIIAAKFDFSRPINLNEQNPIYLNIFNDYGLVWGNKNTVTSSDDSIRASYGFGINYYSPIGPIGFSWGFPLADESYDIKRMFMFTIGNLN